MRKSQYQYAALAVLIVGLVFFISIYFFSPIEVYLEKSVYNIGLIGLFETPWYYAFLHAITLLPVFLMSFDRKVAFYKNWPSLFPSIIIVGLVFIAWDVCFTKLGVWGFNEQYLLSYSLLHLPIEEWLFFLTVPYACIFIYACLDAYFPHLHTNLNDKWFSLGLAISLLLVGIANVGRIYTSITFIIFGVLLVMHYFFIENKYRTKFYLTYLVSLIPFLLINGALTGAFSKEPVVIYNPKEILGIRVFSIPMEDFFYCGLHLFCVIVLFEYFRFAASKKQ